MPSRAAVAPGRTPARHPAMRTRALCEHASRNATAACLQQLWLDRPAAWQQPNTFGSSKAVQRPAPLVLADRLAVQQVPLPGVLLRVRLGGVVTVPVGGWGCGRVGEGRGGAATGPVGTPGGTPGARHGVGRRTHRHQNASPQQGAMSIILRVRRGGHVACRWFRCAAYRGRHVLFSFEAKPG
jgi:hypothetical protein